MQFKEYYEQQYLSLKVACGTDDFPYILENSIKK